MTDPNIGLDVEIVQAAIYRLRASGQRRVTLWELAEECSRVMADAERLNRPVEQHGMVQDPLPSRDWHVVESADEIDYRHMARQRLRNVIGDAEL